LAQAVDTRTRHVDPKRIEDLYDTTAGYDEEIGVRLPEGLSPDDIQRATILYNLFNGLWGVCIVVGEPGSGKDLFGNYITYRAKIYFPWKRILRDEKPRPLFGPYAGLFNEEVLQEDLAKMRAVALGAGTTKIDAILQKAADTWVTSKGVVLLKDSILYLTEYWRYCYNREPHNPMNKTMGGIHKEKRHMDVLIIGTAQMASDLDKFTCLPWIDWRVTCARSRVNKTRFTYFVEKVKYDKRLEVLLATSKPFYISFDAGKPRSYIGDGKVVLSERRRDYRPETEEERIVLDVIKAGLDNYDGIVELLEAEGDMTEWEVLSTLKELKFRPRKRAIDYPCDFSIFNSKSAPQLKSTVRMSD
jgi:hypothetical protein